LPSFEDRSVMDQGEAARPLDPRVLRTRQRLEDAMMDLAATKRLDDISVAELVVAAGVGYATFFRHYPDKQALWNSVTESMIHEINERVAPMIERDDHGAAALEICQFVDSHRGIYRTLLAGGAADHTREMMIADARLMAERSPGRPAWNLPPMLGINFGVNAIFAILAWWLDGNEHVSPNTVADAIDHLVLAPLLASGRGEGPLPSSAS
jgi:AcrR family transcriptional regulator